MFTCILCFSSVQFSSVAQLCPTLCDPMSCRTPGLPVHHHLPWFTQTHVHGVGDTIQPSHPLSSPFPPAPNPSQHQSFQWVIFSNESTLRMRWPKYWSFSFSIIPSKEHPGLISFRMDWLLTPKKDVLFIIGDWNAKVGSQETPGVTGKFGLGIWNEAGQMLIEFCQENALVIANTLFQQHKRRLYTWTSPDGQPRNQIDYILCSQRWRSSIQSAKEDREQTVAQIMSSLLPHFIS